MSDKEEASSSSSSVVQEKTKQETEENGTSKPSTPKNSNKPINFGVELLEVSSHNNFVFNAASGKQVKVNSAILASSSPAVAEAVENLGMNTFDLVEHSEESVRVVVEAVYSGSAPIFSRELFRDVYKISHVLQIEWLQNRLVEQFKTQILDCSGEYEDWKYFFLEAVYQKNVLKKDTFLGLVGQRMESLGHMKEFLRLYLLLDDMRKPESSNLICVDPIIEMVGKTNTSPILFGVLKEQIEQIETTELIPDHIRLLLNSINISICFAENRSTFDELFDLLQKFESSNRESHLEWVLSLHRRTFKKQKINQGAKKITLTRLLNVFHPALENLKSWNGAFAAINGNKFAGSKFLILAEAIRKFNGNDVAQSIVELLVANEHTLDDWFSFDTSLTSMCALSLRKNPTLDNNIRLLGQVMESFALKVEFTKLGWEADPEDKVSVEDFFKKKRRMTFFFPNHPLVANCKKDGQCGFILEVCPNNRGLPDSVSVLVDNSLYPEELHYHKEFNPDKMHLLPIYKDNENPNGRYCSSSFLPFEKIAYCGNYLHGCHVVYFHKD